MVHKLIVYFKNIKLKIFLTYIEITHYIKYKEYLLCVWLQKLIFCK